MNRDDCREPELIDLYYGDLDPGERERLEGHLQDCAECREKFAEIRGLLDGILLTDPDISSADVARFSADVARRAKKPTKFKFPAWAPPLAGAVVLAVLIVSRWPDNVKPVPLSRLATDREVLDNMEFLRDLPLLENLDWLRELEESG